jgi:hypothetical protein
MSSGSPLVPNSWKLPSLSRRRPTVAGQLSTSQMLPSGPTVIARGLPVVVPGGKCATPPAVVTPAIFFAVNSVT